MTNQNWEDRFNNEISNEQIFDIQDNDITQEVFAFIRTVEKAALEQGRREIYECCPCLLTIKKEIKENDLERNHRKGYEAGYNKCIGQFLSNLKQKGIV